MTTTTITPSSQNIPHGWTQEENTAFSKTLELAGRIDLRVHIGACAIFSNELFQRSYPECSRALAESFGTFDTTENVCFFSESQSITQFLNEFEQGPLTRSDAEKINKSYLTIRAVWKDATISCWEIEILVASAFCKSFLKFLKNHPDQSKQADVFNLLADNLPQKEGESIDTRYAVLCAESGDFISEMDKEYFLSCSKTMEIYGDLLSPLEIELGLAAKSLINRNSTKGRREAVNPDWLKKQKRLIDLENKYLQSNLKARFELAQALFQNRDDFRQLNRRVQLVVLRTLSVGSRNRDEKLDYKMQALQICKQIELFGDKPKAPIRLFIAEA